MKLNIDTDRMRDMIDVLQTANGEIDSATEKLLSITTHSGWACKERYTINNYILENRASMKTLQTESANFFRVVKAATEEFIETERSISQMFPGVESALARILSNPVASVVFNPIPVGSLAQSVRSYHIDGGDLAQRMKDKFIQNVGKHVANIKRIGCGLDWGSTAPSLVSLSQINLSGKQGGE